MKKQYLVRTNCEYSIEVEAESEDEAFFKAGKIPYSKWQQAWAPCEIDDEQEIEVETCHVCGEEFSDRVRCDCEMGLV